MKVLTRFLAGGILVCAIASAAHPQKVNPDIPCGRATNLPEGCLESTYDKFDRVTSVSLSHMLVHRDSLYLTLIGVYLGTEPAVPQELIVAFLLNTTKAGGRFSDGCKLTVLAGDERLVYQTSPSGSTGNVQAIGVKMPYSDFRKIAEAKAVDMRVETAEFSLDDRQMEALRKFAARFGDKVTRKN